MYLGSPLGYLMLSLMALIGDAIYHYYSNGFMGQPGYIFRSRSFTCWYFEPLDKTALEGLGHLVSRS